MDAISVEISLEGGLLKAATHFNLIKCSTTVTAKSIEELCTYLAKELRSTGEKVLPLLGRSSADTARFEPNSIGLNFADTATFPNEWRSAVQLVVSGFIEEKVELMQLLAESERNS